jgi:acyl-CoA reductase-like NAD-dependent aldehyde dehydrogenase
MKIKLIKNYVKGAWITPENTGYLDVENPSTGEILGKVPL